MRVNLEEGDLENLFPFGLANMVRYWSQNSVYFAHSHYQIPITLFSLHTELRSPKTNLIH